MVRANSRLVRNFGGQESIFSKPQQSYLPSLEGILNHGKLYFLNYIVCIRAINPLIGVYTGSKLP